MTNQYNRIFGLDILRSFAVICVLIAHTFPILTNNWIIQVISSYGAIIGVEIFFVLSGFLIGTILIKTNIKDEITTFTSIKVFWIRRWFRTLPNYYLMIIVYSLLYYLIHHNIYGYIVPYLFFVQNSVSEMQNDFFAVSWSLSVEEWFYLLFPLILFGVQFIYKKKSVSFFITTLIFIILPLLIKIYFALTSNIAWDAGFRKIVPFRLDAIGIGVLLAYIKFYFNNIWEIPKKAFFIVGAISFSLLMVVCYYKFILTYDSIHAKELNDSGIFLKTVFFTFLSISIAMLIPLIYTIQVKNTKSYLYKFINLISLISYSLYLIHPIIIFLTLHFLKNYNGFLNVSVIWTVSIILAYLQYIFFEKKITNLREKFSSKKYAVTI